MMSFGAGTGPTSVISKSGSRIGVTFGTARPAEFERVWGTLNGHLPWTTLHQGRQSTPTIYSDRL